MIFDINKEYKGKASIKFFYTGFYSRINILILAVLYCINEKLSLSIDMKEWAYILEKGWEDFFLPLSDDQANLQTLDNFNTWAPDKLRTYDYRNIENLELKLYKNQVFENAREIAFNIYQFQSKIQKLVEDRIKEANLPEKYHAIHVRRGDKLYEYIKIKPDNHHTNKYISKLPRKTHQNIFIASDTSEPLKEVNKSNSNIFSLIEQSRAGHDQKTFNSRMQQRSKEEKLKEIIDLFAEVEICRRSDYFIGTYASNLSRFIHLTHNNPKHCFAVEEGAQWFLG